MSKEKPTTGSTSQVAPQEKPGAKTPASASAAKGAETSQGAKPGKPPKSEAPAKPRAEKSGSGAATATAATALLLALGGGAGAGYVWYEQQNLVEKQAVLERKQAAAVDKSQLASLKHTPFDSSGLESSIAGLEGNVTELNEQLGTLESGMGVAQQSDEEFRQLTKENINRLAAENSDLMQRLIEIGRTNRDDWRLAEVEYLLRLAHQRVVMGGELDAAEALLADADNIMYELNMAGLLHVRRQVANDLAAVRSASKLDLTGLYLQLEAVQQQVGDLEFFGLPEAPSVESSDEPAAAAAEDSGADEDWRDSVSKGWDTTMQKFQELVIVQKRDGEVEPLMSAAGQALVRVQIGLKLEQAKIALLRQQSEIYNATLDKALALVQGNFELEDQVTVSVIDSLESLRAVDIDPEMPDLSASQQAIRAFIDSTYDNRNQVSPLDGEVDSDQDSSLLDEEEQP